MKCIATRMKVYGQKVAFLRDRGGSEHNLSLWLSHSVILINISKVYHNCSKTIKHSTHSK